MANESELIIKQTQTWLHSFVVKFNLCPFARREINRRSLRITVSRTQKIEKAIKDFLHEIILLDRQQKIETTLLIFSYLFEDFSDYLDFINLCEEILRKKNYEGSYQIASFHPDYCFADEAPTDVSNYTNRSPYPMIHLLREESLEKAIQLYGETTIIPANNIKTLQKLGLEEIKKILLHCKLSN
ncbi:DUF1415 domain-containing protein [Legionella cardiaca]|uniref:DUF1415 domain-containing protein n=1 Tax=Legionella cardiaca TaxID=1071983 RepID=A0ABY8AVF3_9GAMM|nr:DUF1415 domain-containing protein [Legionella cardiaca]WED44558.1 DUF1415 domain-containing protein [Legionella cardiaca]